MKYNMYKRVSICLKLHLNNNRDVFVDLEKEF